MSDLDAEHSITTSDPSEKDLDDGPRRQGRLMERTCIVCRDQFHPDELIRFVVGPDGALVPDLQRKLPGRGAWVRALAEHVTQAQTRKVFARVFRKQVGVSATLAEDVSALLKRDALQALALANKASAVVTGFSKVESACAQAGIIGVIHALDAKEDGIRKLAQAIKRGRLSLPHGESGSASHLIVVRDFTSEELDLALGRTHVIHAALVAGSGCDGFVARWLRLARYKGVETPYSFTNGNHIDDIGDVAHIETTIALGTDG